MSKNTKINEQKAVHIWEKIEVVLSAQEAYENPYTDVDVWVDLNGPGFNKRVFGFWDGENIFRIRLTAIKPGEWNWTSASNQVDSGLNGIAGHFTAIEWSEDEKVENPCRRGMIQPTNNGHSFQYADSTPVILLGDTWWAAPTFRFKWYDDDTNRPIGPEMGFKDLVRIRKEQGFNAIGMIAAFPTWADDGKPSTLRMDDEKKTAIRAAWQVDGTSSSDAGKVYKPAKAMHNEGGRAFLFPGRVTDYEDIVPDFDRINPEYFKHIDKKLDYLNEHGFTAFIEVSRRDISQVWKSYYDWPISYARYIQYIYARYQANNCLNSPIHFDYEGYAIPSREFNEPANLVVEKFGHPPFGTLQGTNAAPSTLVNFGGPEEAKWLTFHQIGNWRQHDHYWYLTEIFQSSPAMPAINGEPYYPGHPESLPPKIDADGKLHYLGRSEDAFEASTEEDNLNFRSGMYGSFLSGGLGGVIYGAEGMWGGNIEPNSVYKIWDAITFESGNQVKYLNNFAMIQGTKYQSLIPSTEFVTPNKDGDHLGFRGWAYCSTTKEKDFFLLYFEKDCPRATVRGLLPWKTYKIMWFDPRTGEWINDSDFETISSDGVGRIMLPKYPSNGDWGSSLILNEN